MNSGVWLATAVFLTSTGAGLSDELIPGPGAKVIPPPMPRRAIAPGTNAPPVTQVTLKEQSAEFTLILPDGWDAVPTNRHLLSVHFHCVEWFVLQEHLCAGYSHPLVVFNVGRGSTVYRRLVEDSRRFADVLGIVEEELQRRGAPADSRIATVDVSSFSAGYGAVRELMKSPDYRRIIRRLVLADSMYAAFDPSGESGPAQRPDPQQIEPWLPFAREAMAGRKTFVFTHSAVPTGKYASTSDCAAALIAALGAPKPVAVTADSLPAAQLHDHPLLTRCDVGGFHVWGYGGVDAQAHLTHVRHLADIWRALDKAEER